MHNEIIELNDSDSDHARPVKQESNDTPHLNLEVTALKASLTAKTKLVAEQGKDSELTKLRKKNKQLKNEQPNGTVVEATGHQDVDQDMSDNIASNLLMPEHAPNATPPWPSNSNTSRSSLTVKAEPVNTIIQVVIKSENEPDLIERITFVKSEDGKFDVWNLKHLSLGPPVVVEERFRVRFPRPMISDVSSGFPYLVNQANLAITSGSWRRSANHVEQLARSYKIG
jgi:hypothetical protein